LVGIGLWIWGDGSDSYNGFLVFLGWVFIIGAVVVYRKGKKVEVTEEEVKIVEDFLKDEVRQTDANKFPEQKIKEIPLENLGFSGFVLEYAWNMSLSERNKTILSVFPKRFWNDLGVSFDDVLAHADILCDKRSALTIEIQKKEDEWLVKYGHKIALAMQKLTAKDGEFRCRGNSSMENGVLVNKDDEEHRDFLSKVGNIKQAELQIFGLYMLTLLPKEEQKKFLAKAYQSDKYAKQLQLWAEVVCFPFLKQHGLLEKQGVNTTTFFGEITDKYGFVDSISWIRNIPNDYEIEEYVRKYSVIHFIKND
jgi:hypothetical protein